MMHKGKTTFLYVSNTGGATKLKTRGEWGKKDTSKACPQAIVFKREKTTKSEERK